MLLTSCLAAEVGTPESHDLVEMLRLRAAWLSYPAFVLLISRLLKDLGYSHIHSPGRRSYRGRHRFGGVDLFATHNGDIGSRKTIVLLKQYRKKFKVARYFVDGLRGTMLRKDIPHAVVFATVAFSREARRASEAYPGRPVSLFDGTELGKLMLASRIGVIERTDIVTGEVRLEFDELQFELLESHAKLQREEQR